MGWRTFRDRLALLALVVVVPGLWVAHGMKVIALPGEVVGATIAVWTLIAQFYFRKSGPAPNGEPGEPPKPP